MPFHARYLFTASMDIDPAHEALFNQVYEEEHIPTLLKVPGVLSVARFKTRELVENIAGERRILVAQGEPRYSALYEIESPDVITTEAWGRARDLGRWPTQVRPYTSNRRHTLRELISSAMRTAG
ncbi:MAG: hypothetical protein HY683_07595 [Chloroflexi bacterium]|nr:hypothetical protein [Chloroflexota bacterium]